MLFKRNLMGRLMEAAAEGAGAGAGSGNGADHGSGGKFFSGGMRSEASDAFDTLYETGAEDRGSGVEILTPEEAAAADEAGDEIEIVDERTDATNDTTDTTGKKADDKTDATKVAAPVVKKDWLAAKKIELAKEHELDPANAKDAKLLEKLANQEWGLSKEAKTVDSAVDGATDQATDVIDEFDYSLEDMLADNIPADTTEKPVTETEKPKTEEKKVDSPAATDENNVFKFKDNRAYIHALNEAAKADETGEAVVEVQKQFFSQNFVEAMSTVAPLLQGLVDARLQESIGAYLPTLKETTSKANEAGAKEAALSAMEKFIPKGATKAPFADVRAMLLPDDGPPITIGKVKMPSSPFAKTLKSLPELLNVRIPNADGTGVDPVATRIAVYRAVYRQMKAATGQSKLIEKAIDDGKVISDKARSQAKVSQTTGGGGGSRVPSTGAPGQEPDYIDGLSSGRVRFPGSK